MIINFGPATVTHDGDDLGDTFGGGSLELKQVEDDELKDEFDDDPRVIGGTGRINFYSWPASITISTSRMLKDFAQVVLTCRDDITITLYSCKILLAGTMDVGTNTQKPITCDLVFKPDGSGNVINIA